MKNRNYAADIAQSELLYTNAGSPIASGTPIKIGKKWWVAQGLIATGATGTLQTHGDFTFNKADPTATWSQGDLLTFDADLELVKWTPSSLNDPAGWAPEATTNGATTARIVLEEVRGRRIFHHVATAGEVSASNRVVIDTNIGAAIALVGPPIVRSSTGAVRVITDLDITGIPGDVVEFTVTSLAAGDLCEIEVVFLAEKLTV